MVKIKINGYKTANSIITILALLCVSFSVTGIVLILFGSVSIEQIVSHFIARGMPISLFGYKVTRKYYGNYHIAKEKLKTFFPG